MMRTKTSILSVMAILFCLFAGACGGLAGEISKSSDIHNWPLGTSIGRIDQVTAEKLMEVKAAGFDCVEVNPGDLQGEELAASCRQLRRWADGAGLQVWSVHIPYGDAFDISTAGEPERAKVVERVQAMIRSCAPLGAKKFVIHASFEPVKAKERQAKLAASRKSLPQVQRTASDQGAQLVVECLPRTCLGNTSTEMLSILADAPGVGICCDTNHLLQETTQDFIRSVGPLVRTVHIADYDGEDERHWLPGKGIIDWTAVVGALVEAGYPGPFMFECRGTLDEKVATWRRLRQEYLAQASNSKTPSG